jgi:hypothetical protein
LRKIGLAMSGNPKARQCLAFLSKTRVARGLWFVAIVWSIAGAFLALEFAGPELLSRSIRAGWLPGELAMPTQERMPAAVVCRQQDVDTAEAATAEVEDARAMQQMRYASWMLGQKFGFATAMANAGIAGAEMAALREEVQRWAAMLRLPTPAAPQSQHILNQLSDFGDHLEADPQCIAARLTRRYGPRYGYLYKFGAVVGYGTPARVLNVNGAFALQIQLYGRNAGIPQELWLPMTLDSLADLPGVDAYEKAVGLVERLSEHIETSQ